MYLAMWTDLIMALLPLFPPDYHSVDRLLLQTYFKKLQETLYSQGKSPVEEMNKICLFFIMCYEVCNGSNKYGWLSHILVSGILQYGTYCLDNTTVQDDPKRGWVLFQVSVFIHESAHSSYRYTLIACKTFCKWPIFVYLSVKYVLFFS